MTTCRSFNRQQFGVLGALAVSGWLALAPLRGGDAAAQPEASGPKVTMEFDNLSLGDALRYLALASGLQLKVDEHAVLLYGAGRMDEMETRFYAAPPGAFFGGTTRTINGVDIGLGGGTNGSSGTSSGTTSTSGSTLNPARYAAPPGGAQALLADRGATRRNNGGSALATATPGKGAPVSAVLRLSQVAPPPQVNENGAVVIPPANPQLDQALFRRVAKEAAAFREPRCVSEASFRRMSQEPGAIVLDTRSRAEFDQQHVDGAINFDLATLDEAALQRLLPDHHQRILLYGACNFVTPDAADAANILAYVTLYGYGYRNVFELEPRIEAGKTHLAMLPAPPAPAQPPLPQ